MKTNRKSHANYKKKQNFLHQCFQDIMYRTGEKEKNEEIVNKNPE